MFPLCRIFWNLFRKPFQMSYCKATIWESRSCCMVRSHGASCLSWPAFHSPSISISHGYQELGSFSPLWLQPSALPPGFLAIQTITNTAYQFLRQFSIAGKIFKLVEMFSVNTDSKNKGTVRSVLVSLFFSIKGNNLSHH